MIVKSLNISCSGAAVEELERRTAPLVVELELYFSCLIRKRVNIVERMADGAIPLETPHRNVTLYFRPVMTKACGIEDLHGEPDIETFPIVKPEAYIPKWVTLDYKKGKWVGDFGY